MGARAVTAGMAAVLVAVAAGCGGGGGSGPTRAEYASQVNRICADRQDEISKIDSGLEDEAGVRHVISINQDLLAELDDVEAPEDDREAVDRLTALIEEQDRTLEQYADALASGEAPDETAVVDELEAQAAEFDRGADALGLDRCRAAGDDSGSTGTTTTTGVPTPTLADAAQLLVDYMDAYWSGDSAAEQKVSTAWAGALAGFHATADLSPAGAAPAEEVHVELHLTSLDEIQGGYAVNGTVTVTASDATYDYTDVRLADDPTNGLAVADYCRTSSDGYGPLDGCLSDAVGNVGSDLTGADGSYRISMGPMVRSLGMGAQYVDFALCLDSLTQPVQVQGGLNTTFVVGSDINSPSGDGVVLSPAALGQRSCGYIEMSPPTAATDTSFPAGELSIRIQKGDGSTVDVTVPTPALPQSSGQL
jgi:hypothetical protein